MNNEFLPRRKAKQTSQIISPNSGDQHKDIEQDELQESPEQAPNLATISTSADNSSKDNAPSSKKIRRSPAAWFKGLSAKKQIAVVLGIIALLIGVAGVAYWFLRPKPQPKPAVVAPPPPPAPVKTTEPSRLTGVEVKTELNKRPVTAIMIENSPDARPQSGLIDSGIVFEAIAEGGITRFLTLHQEDQPEYIGPVRSVRPYYIDWLRGFDAAVAHVGGSADGLAKIRDEGIKDLDQFANPDAYWRVNTRYAPHNMYTSMSKLDAVNQRKGYTSSTFTSLPRKAEKASAAPTARSIDLAISSYLYNAHFDYEAGCNCYKRSEGGKPHVDEKSGTQIAPKVVVALVMNYGIAPNGVNSVYANIGSNKVTVFQDGVATTGTWTKGSGPEQISLKDAAGKTIELNPGQTWFSVVSNEGAATFKP